MTQRETPRMLYILSAACLAAWLAARLAGL